MCNCCLSLIYPICVVFPPFFRRAIVIDASTLHKVYQLLTHGRWFSPGTPASTSTKTGRHDITEILLKVALKHQKSIQILHISSTCTRLVIGTRRTVGSAKKFVRISSGFGGRRFAMSKI